MPRRTRIALLAVASLVATVLAIGSFATRAQVIDSTPCQRSCYEQKAECVSACGTHPNPIECEESCHDQLQDCLKECR